MTSCISNDFMSTILIHMDRKQVIHPWKIYQIIAVGCIVIAIVIILITQFARTKKRLAMTDANAALYNVALKHNIIVSGTSEIVAPLGTDVTFSVISDTPGTFQINGYPNHVVVLKNIPAYVTVHANQPGHFVYSLNNSTVSYGSLNVSAQ